MRKSSYLLLIGVLAFFCSCKHDNQESSSDILNGELYFKLISLGALDSDTDSHVRWISENLNIGDKVSIEVKEISNSNDPIHIIDQQTEEILIESKLRAYEALKMELSIKGLI